MTGVMETVVGVGLPFWQVVEGETQGKEGVGGGICSEG